MIVLLVLMLPLMLLITRARLEERLSRRDQLGQGAQSMAGNVILDYMRQLSQTASMGVSTETLTRPESLYPAGRSEVSSSFNPATQSVAISAKFHSGNPSGGMATMRKLNGVIRFVSDLTLYSTIYPTGLDLTADNVTWDGRVYSNGDYNLGVPNGGNNLTYNGDVFVNGKLTVAGNNITINGDVYATNYVVTGAGYNLNGTRYTHCPPLRVPPVDREHYALRSNLYITNDTTITFDGLGNLSYIKLGGASVSVPIPAEGIVVFAENCSVTVRGTVRGRVALVNAGTSATVTIRGNVRYANGTNQASLEDSLAVFVQNIIDFDPDGPGNQTVNGIFASDQTGVGYPTPDGPRYITFLFSTTFNLFGTRGNVVYGSGTHNYNDDPNLLLFPPPGLPSFPALVSYTETDF
jgi:hypothetical protein